MDTIGKLYLIPVTLGEVNPLEVLPISIKKVTESLQHFIVENEKTARKNIKALVPSKYQPDLVLYPLNKFTDDADLPRYLETCLNGTDMGLMSEAGVPGIADPGAKVVQLAHNKGIQVVPLVVPSSILLAMMASGLNGQNFAFNGYLPIDVTERRKKIKELEQKSKRENQSQIFIETPYRNNKLIEELLIQLHPDSLVTIACDITTPQELIRTKTVSQWKKQTPDIHKRPAIFIIQGQVF